MAAWRSSSINGVVPTGGAQSIAVTNGTVVIAANGSMTFAERELQRRHQL